MTRDGWKTVDQLQVGDEALTYNVEADVTEWQPVQDIATFDYNGIVMSLNGQRDEFLFTPDHRWPVWHATTNGGEPLPNQRKVVRGYELRSSHRIPKSAPHTFNGADESITVREASLLGWLFTDGHLRCRRDKYWEAVVYQKKEQHLDAIRKLLGDDARAEYTHPDTGVIRFTMSAGLSRRLVELCPNKDALPALVTRLTKPAAEAMWQAMFDAEGHSHPRAGLQFAQQGGPVLAAFQLLSILLNRTADVGTRAEDLETARG